MVLHQDRVTFRFRFLPGAQEICVLPAGLAGPFELQCVLVMVVFSHCNCTVPSAGGSHLEQ